MARLNDTPEMTATRLRYAEAAKAWAEAVLASPGNGAAGDALEWAMRSALCDYERACARAFVRCADEFGDDIGATAEHYDAFERAQERLARAWDGEPVEPVEPARGISGLDAAAQMRRPAYARVYPKMRSTGGE